MCVCGVLECTGSLSTLLSPPCLHCALLCLLGGGAGFSQVPLGPYLSPALPSETLLIPFPSTCAPWRRSPNPPHHPHPLSLCILDSLGLWPLAVPQVRVTSSPKPDSLPGLSGFRNITAAAQGPGSHPPIPSAPAGWNPALFQAPPLTGLSSNWRTSNWIVPSFCLVPHSLQEAG